MIKLYEFELSGNCHKIRLLLSFLSIQYTSCKVNGKAREHKTADFLAMNPHGQVPVLKDGEKIIYDSKKILIYLARAYGLPHWYPHNTKEAASIDAWLTVAEQDVTHGPNALRFHHKFGRALNVEEATVITNKLLHHLDKHLTQHEWLATTQITIADIAMYPYLALANEGHVNVSLFPAVEKWLARIEALPGYISMPGIRVHV